MRGGGRYHRPSTTTPTTGATESINAPRYVSLSCWELPSSDDGAGGCRSGIVTRGAVRPIANKHVHADGLEGFLVQDPPGSADSFISLSTGGSESPEPNVFEMLIKRAGVEFSRGGHVSFVTSIGSNVSFLLFLEIMSFPKFCLN